VIAAPDVERAENDEEQAQQHPDDSIERQPVPRAPPNRIVHAPDYTSVFYWDTSRPRCLR
jgi:hypothetical protein